MLVLARKETERLIIGTAPNLIIVDVTEIHGDKVRLGVTAPDDVPIHREEVYERIHGPLPPRTPGDGKPLERQRHAQKESA